MGRRIFRVDSPSTLTGVAVNIACGEHITINEIIARINKLTGKNVRPNYLDTRPGDIKHSWADIQLAEKVIGYRPTIKFDEGLERTVEWYSDGAPIRRETMMD